MAAKKCLICNCSFRGRVDARTCSARCRKRLQLVRSSLVPAAVPTRVSTPAVSIRVRRGGRARKLMILAVLALFGIISLLLSSAPQRAAAVSTDSNLNFQARLLTNTGAVVPDGNYNIDFKIYTADGVTGSVGTCTSTCVWEETRKNSNSQGVPVVNGYFSVNLGSVTAFSGINWDQQLYLTMNIGGTTTGASPTWDGEMQNSGHSIQITAVPYAFRAGAVAKTDGSGNIGTLSFGSVTNNPVITLPNETGTVCTTGSVCSGYAPASGSGNYIQNTTSLQSANVTVQAATSGSVAATFEANSAGSGDILDLKNGSDVLIDSVASDGSALFGASSTTAFQIQHSGNNLFIADNTNNRIGIGAAPANYLLTIGTNTTANTGGIIFGTDTSADLFRAGSASLRTNGSLTVDVTLQAATLRSDQLFSLNSGVDAMTIQAANGITLNSKSLVKTSGGDTAGAFQVQNHSSVNLFSIDNSSNIIGIGIASTAVTDTINIGTNNTSGATNVVHIADASTATETISIGSNNVTGNSLSLDAGSTGNITIGNSTSSHTINIASANQTTTTQTINIANGTSTTSGGETVNIANGTPGTGTTNAVNIGSGGSTTGTVGVTIGSIGAAAHTTTIQGGNGSGAISIQAAASGTISVGTTNNNVINIGGAGQTSQITLGQGTGSNTISIGSAAGASATQTINIGTSATATSTTNIVLGSTVAGTTTIQSASGVVLGKSSSTNGSAVFAAAGGSNTVTLQLAANPTSSYVMQLPTAIASSNQCLAAGTVSGGNVPLTFANCSNGVTTVGTYSNSNNYSNGASISGTTITLGSANASNPGLVDTSAQTFAGAKTFTGDTLVKESSTHAFQIQDASTNQYLNVDTSGSTITTESGTLNLSNGAAAHTINIGAGASGSGYAFPQNGVIDNFNRASLGSNWTNDPLGFGTSTLSISGSTVLGATSSDGNDYYNVSTYGPDSEVYATVSTLPTGAVDPTSVGLRVDPTAHNAYVLGYKPSVNQFQMSSDVGGSLTPIGAWSVTMSAGDKIGLSAIGTTITAYWYHSGAWSTVGSVTDSSLSSAGYLMAFIDSANGGKLDDFGGGTVTAVPSTNQSITIGSTNGASALTLQAGTGNLNVSSGATIFKPNTNGTNTFEIQNSATNVMFNVDTSNGLVEIGYPTADGVATQLVLDGYTTSTDPTGTNGAMYYNSARGMFRCYQNGGWKDCLSGNDFDIILGSDFTVTNTNTLATVTGFSVPVSSGDVWEVSISGADSASSTTTNISCVLTATSSATWSTTQSYWVGHSFTSVPAIQTQTGSAPSSTTTILAAGTAVNRGDGSVRPLDYDGHFVMTASGNITFQCANAAAGTGTSTVKAGTIMSARKI